MIAASQIIVFFVLAPLFFSAFAFCPFKMPYLYCFICPVRCVWYQIRGIVLLIALGLNIKKGLFCAQICPLGTIQVFLSKISPKKITLPKFMGSLKYASIILLVSIIVISKMPRLSNQISITKFGGLLLGILLLSITVSIFSYRFFCRNICPIKGLSSILDRIKAK